MMRCDAWDTDCCECPYPICRRYEARSDDDLYGDGGMPYDDDYEGRDPDWARERDYEV